MALYLTRSGAAAIQKHAVEAYPEECCGILGGIDGERREVREAHGIPNARAESRQTRYLIPPDEYVKAEKTFRDKGLDVVGFYHSHPDHPARPSEFDREHAWPWYTYIIVGVNGGRPVLTTAWSLRDDRSTFDREEIVVEGD